MSAPHLRFLEETGEIEAMFYGGLILTTEREMYYPVGLEQNIVTVYDGSSLNTNGMIPNSSSGKLKIQQAGTYHIDCGFIIKLPMMSANAVLEIRGTTSGLLCSRSLLTQQDESPQRYTDNAGGFSLVTNEEIYATIRRPSTVSDDVFTLKELRFFVCGG